MTAHLLAQTLSAVAALAAVLALIWGAQWAARRGGRGGGNRRLQLAESIALDARHRLHLVRCDARFVLLQTGGSSDPLVGWLPDDTTAADADPPPGSATPAPFARGGGARVASRLIPLLLVLALPIAAHAQSVSIDLGTAGASGATGRLVQLTALITVLSLAPSLLVMVTAFTRIVIVLSLLRTALGTQSTPPNVVLIGLALFLTWFVMQPVLDQAWSTGLLPMSQGKIGELDGIRLAAEPFRGFMLHNLRSGDLQLFLNLAHLPPPGEPAATPWRALIPAFMVGELRRAFEMGFLLFLPFLVIDLVVASVLMSLGMMMLPPTAVSLPFKIIFFVLVDGWRLVSGSLVESFLK